MIACTAVMPYQPQMRIPEVKRASNMTYQSIYIAFSPLRELRPLRRKQNNYPSRRAAMAGDTGVVHGPTKYRCMYGVVPCHGPYVPVCWRKVLVIVTDRCLPYLSTYRCLRNGLADLPGLASNMSRSHYSYDCRHWYICKIH